MLRARRGLSNAAGLAIATIALAGSASLAHAGADVGNPRFASASLGAEDTAVVHHELGLLLGTPGALNLEAGYWADPMAGVRASGMYFGGSFWGFQGGFCFTVRRGPHSRVALAAIGGTHRENHDYWNYGGGAIDWNAEPFFAELGPVILSSNNGNFNGHRFAVVAQVGVMGGGGTRGPR